MCTVFEATRAEGRAEGKAEGKAEGIAEGIIKMGHEFGLSESDILNRLQRQLNISQQKAREYIDLLGRNAL